MARHDAFIDHLQQVPMFSVCSKRDLQLVARRAEDVRVAAGKVLVNEGETGHEFFVIVDGKVKVSRKGRRIATSGAPDFVGEIALIEEIPRTATVTAETPVCLFVLTRKDFRHLLDENRSVERKLLRALARRLAEMSSDPTLA